MTRILQNAEAMLLVVDLQEKLMPHIHEQARVIARTRLLIEAAKILELPILVSEQYKKGFGETVPEIKAVLPPGAPAFEKMAFGCFGDEALHSAIAGLGRKQIILAGVEAHVCILQSALRAIEEGYTVFLAEDALGSRRTADRDAALRRLVQAGAIPATAEMLIMEALGAAGTPRFKAILPLLREI